MRREYPSQLAQGAYVIFDVLDDVHRTDQIERVIRERQIDDGCNIGACTSFAQASYGSFTDIDKASSCHRQARTQAGRDFQAARVRAQQRFDQRPGIEALGPISCDSPHNGS